MFNTLPGKLICHVVCAALALPSITLGLAVRANAQLSTRKLWAVMPFVDRKGGHFGQAAAEALTTALSTRQDEFKPPIEVAPPDTVTRALSTLSLTAPVTDKTSILRVGQELRASTLITGEVVNYRVRSVSGGKQASVIIRAEAINVASGLPINGAAIQSDSTVKASSTPDEDLIGQAINIGTEEAVGRILGQTLPTGTVLNTTGREALINQGSRSGFKSGQTVVVLRNREQVAVAKVTDVEFDQSSVQVIRPGNNGEKGIAPGDSVQVIFEVPDVTGNFGEGGTPISPPKHAHSNNSALISVALVLALGVFLVMNSNNNSPFSGATAEALLYPDSSGQPAVKVSWRPDLFAKGLSQRYAFQVWRNDLTTSPVFVTDGATTYGYDLQNELQISAWYNFGNVIGGSQCNGLPASASVTPTGLTPGKPYTYGVELVYALSQNDLPGTVTTGSSAGSGSTSTATTSTGTTSTGTGTTAGTTTGGTTTGGTTGGTTTGNTTTGTTSTGTGTTSTGTTGNTGASICYFVSNKTYTKLATPLNRISLVSPANNAVVTAPIPFTFQAVATAANPIVVQYVIQFSTDPGFPAGSTYTLTPFQRADTGALSTPTIDTQSTSFPSSVANATQVWWRVGARNVADSPGPVQDATGARYVYSAPIAFTRPTTNPPGAASRKATRTTAVKTGKKG
jgi:hypothetical protein